MLSTIALCQAIGMLLRRFGEERAPDLVEWLLMKMEDGNNQIERHGAALCLAEVLYVLGIGRFKVGTGARARMPLSN